MCVRASCSEYENNAFDILDVTVRNRGLNVQLSMVYNTCYTVQYSIYHCVVIHEDR